MIEGLAFDIMTRQPRLLGLRRYTGKRSQSRVAAFPRDRYCYSFVPNPFRAIAILSRSGNSNMAKKPEIKMSNEDRRLLDLLEKLFDTITFDRANFRNVPRGYAILSRLELEILIHDLENYIDQSYFARYAYFIDNIFLLNRNDRVLREIYLSERKKRGRSRAMSSKHWAELLSRLGLEDRRWSANVEPMDEQMFLRLEEQLINVMIKNKSFRTHILETVSQNSPFKMGDSKARLDSGNSSAYAGLSNILADLRSASNSRGKEKPISATRLSAIGGLLIDGAAMFTTRDWSTAATYSGLATTAVLALTPD
jgi:hypothetical protein